jgi:DNA polymerase-3 subunit alpha/error-prone DNA polymerase
MYLNCHSYHSLRYGTIPNRISPTGRCGVKAMALTDINTVTGIYDFIKECQAVAINPSSELNLDTTTLLYIGLKKRFQVLPK